MAKRKRRSHRRSGRRMSGAGGGYKNTLMIVLGSVAGAIGGRVLATTIAGGMNPNLVSLGQIGAGAYVANHAKEPFFIGLGLGCAGEGATSLMQRKGIIKGIAGEDDSMVLMSGDEDYLSGDEDYLSGDEDNSAVAGVGDDDIAGDDDDNFL